MFLKISNYHLSSVFCHLSSALYICREPSTNQPLFMQNKPNFRKSQMNVKTYNTRAYENKHNWTIGQNKPNQSQFPKVQNELKIACRKVWPHPKLFRELECSCKVAKDSLLFRSLHARKRFAVRILDLNSCYLIAWYHIKLRLLQN